MNYKIRSLKQTKLLNKSNIKQMSCNVRKLSDTYSYNVVKGKVERNLSRQGGRQILDNFPNGYTCTNEQNGR